MSGLQLDLSGVINTAIDNKMAEFDVEGQIKAMLEDVAKNSSKVLTIKMENENKEGKKFPLVHKQFESLLKLTTIPKTNPLLTGGAGLSKTTAVEQVAEALELDLVTMSFSNQTSKTDLMGFVDANGIYRKSGFVDAFENGKLFLADEIDACGANVSVLLNSAIDNLFITTPENKVLHAHKNFRLVATANTNLRGAKDGFTGRNKLDAAFIDRFTVLDWTLDEELEEKITNNEGWLKIVRKCRTIAEEQLESVAITPRSSYKGAELLRHGFSADEVIKMVIIKAMGIDEEETLLKGITENMKKTAEKHAKKDDDIPKEAEYEEKMTEADEKEPEYEEITDDDVEAFTW